VLPQFPKPKRIPKIERRAECIADPVERLRYLRRITAPERQRHFGKHSVTWMTLAAALILVPSSRPKGSMASAMASNVPIVRQEQAPSTKPAEAAPQVPSTPERVWRVEKSSSTELYSNGLRVDVTLQVSNRPRAHFPIFAIAGGREPVTTGSAPIGIVYHTTESLIAPFEEEQNRRLKQLGRNVLDLIRREHAYHYFIDRFGRVFSVVSESDAANHAGRSVWADEHGIYVDLNDSFLGVAFEAQTEATEEVTPAQVAAAKLLTEMLRSRYGIAAGNCVTHAQVSVNPDNMRIGAHTDWAGDFPFRAIGLPDNYATPPASMTAFGFDYDGVFLEVAGSRWHGLDVADEQLTSRAAAEGITVARYRMPLRHRYKEIAAALKQAAEAGEVAQ
jgi:N-acetyl-anhydromuramyl-L-alanine amidase AmpD